MAKDWETLGADYESSSSVLIAEVDCTQVASGNPAPLILSARDVLNVSKFETG
jgi:hypothetical protein